MICIISQHTSNKSLSPYLLLVPIFISLSLKRGDWCSDWFVCILKPFQNLLQMSYSISNLSWHQFPPIRLQQGFICGVIFREYPNRNVANFMSFHKMTYFHSDRMMLLWVVVSSPGLKVSHSLHFTLPRRWWTAYTSSYFISLLTCHIFMSINEPETRGVTYVSE